MEPACTYLHLCSGNLNFPSQIHSTCRYDTIMILAKIVSFLYDSENIIHSCKTQAFFHCCLILPRLLKFSQLCSHQFDSGFFQRPDSLRVLLPHLWASTAALCFPPSLTCCSGSAKTMWDAADHRHMWRTRKAGHAQNQMSGPEVCKF